MVAGLEKEKQMSHISRRRFLQVAAQSSAVALTAEMAVHTRAWSAPQPRPQPQSQSQSANPNILVIIVDQMRYPQWFDEAGDLDQRLPNIARVKQGAVNFTHHYAAATACTPSRACMLTGLYTHQHYCMITQTSYLNTDFPTWGTNLRQFGYDTHWFGKWHVSDDCNGADPPYTYLEPYGFNTYTCPDPHGTPGQGLQVDDDIAVQFADWLKDTGSQATKPWCATVSFVNPHDIMFYPRLIPPEEDNAASVFSALPPNYETRAQLQAAQKPSLQQELIQAANRQFGSMGYKPSDQQDWISMLDVYLYMHELVDTQIGVVLDALDAAPAVKANTVVIFTADHGDYCGSHGLRGKGGAVYEESIRVPLCVKDYSGQLAAQPGARTQLTSHIDLSSLLMTIAYGSGDWRSQSQYSHLAHRLDLLSIVQNPAAPGRDYILHTTDEPGLEEKIDVDYAPFSNDTPKHVICYRTNTGKFSTYSFWRENTNEILTNGQEVECYDYAAERGRLELDNITDPSNALYVDLQNRLVNDALPNELREPVPDSMQDAQIKAMTQYLIDLGQGYRVYLPSVEG